MALGIIYFRLGYSSEKKSENGDVLKFPASDKNNGRTKFILPIFFTNTLELVELRERNKVKY